MLIIPSATPLNTIHLKNYVPMCFNKNLPPSALRLGGPVSSAWQIKRNVKYSSQQNLLSLQKKMQSKLFCLESVPDVTSQTSSIILPSLEKLALQYNITNVYQTCDSIEGLEESLSTLLYEDRNFNDYEIIYFVFQGSGNNIIIDNYLYSLEEIAEFFEGKLTNKRIHFANTLQLDLDSETAQYFLDVTGAISISGYRNPAPILSTIIDNPFFSLCQEYDDVTDIVEELFEKHYTIAKGMGFTLYY
jgi:hypothetical protein